MTPSRSPLVALLGTRTLRVVLVLHALLGLALLGVPLFDVLGFERALASALLTSLTAPLLGLRAARLGRALGGEPLGWWGAALVFSLVAPLPSLAAGLGLELVTLPCDVETGALFFLLLAGGNALFGSILGFVAGATAPETGRLARLVPGLVVGVVLLGWLLATFRRLYAEPQVYAWATPFGYWPGSLYDEALTVTPALWAFRGFGLLLGLAVLFLARGSMADDSPRIVRAPRLGHLALALLAGAGAAWMHASGGPLGFDLDRDDVRRVLARRVETEHFVLHVDPTLDVEAVERLADAHELRWRALRRFFGVAPEAKIRSFVYRDPAQKGHLMGAARTQIARPWIGEIHIHGAEVPHPVLEHELAHIFAGALADPPFRIPLLFGLFPNIGLIEGIAVAADDPVRELTLHQWAAAMLRLDRLPEVRRSLDPAGFWSISSSRAYTATGSFVRWLVDDRGMEAFARLYRGGTFEASYGEPAETLERGWRTFLEGIPLSEEALRKAEHRFSRPSIFGKTCARASATLAADAYARLGAGDVAGAAPDLERLYARARSDPRPLVALGRAWLRGGDVEAAREVASRALATPGATEAALAQARELEGEILWKTGALEEARARFAEVEALALSAASVRLQAVRRAALDRGEPIRSTLRAYLGGELTGARALVELGALTRARPEDPILRYLRARQLEAAGAPDAGLAWADRPEALPTPALRDEARLTRARLALAAGTPTTAASLFEVAERLGSTPAVRAAARDGALRARFVAEATE